MVCIEKICSEICKNMNNVYTHPKKSRSSNIELLRIAAMMIYIASYGSALHLCTAHGCILYRQNE